MPEQSRVLGINGLSMPADFPVALYENVHSIIVANRIVPKTQDEHPAYLHYSRAWSAVAYRYLGAVESGADFLGSLAAHGSSPPPEERFVQERALFEFFSAGFSVFEATFYAAFAIGALVAKDAFPLASEADQQRISPATTKTAFGRAFPGDPINAVFKGISDDARYQQWREIRNVLTHRAAPGRRFYVSIGSDDAPPAQWQLKNLTVDNTLIGNERGELARLLQGLLDGISVFASTRLKTT